jgi:hypothetical protein
MSHALPITTTRRAILDTLPEETSLFGGAPMPRFTHIPASHAKALHPDVQVVKGMRGSGKSFWWAALQNKQIRRLVAQRVPSLRVFTSATIYAGFGESADPERYPGMDTLTHLLENGHDPRLIWRTVVLRALGWPRLADASKWEMKIDQVRSNPEEVERFLYEMDTQLGRDDRHAIVLFDALDRCATDWDTMNCLIRGLLQTTLDFRPYRRLRLKLFLRTDQLDERKVANFPDASKVLSSSLELTWPVPELYAMLFQYLGNGDTADFREAVEEQFGGLWRQTERVWIPNESLARDEKRQRDLFHAITGPWMGRDHRRGFPYSWVPGHLSDAAGRTSPRSFLAALRKAAENSEQRYQDHEWPLHYESIKRGVQTASSIRRRELQEDVPWVDALLQPLEGKVVPCAFEEVASAWEQSGVIERMRNSPDSGSERLPPAHLSEGPVGLRQDLEDLAIFLRMADDRVNIPDVFRVAYGLGRRGGVKPLRRGEG